jgi:beta-mannan synthase
MEEAGGWKDRTTVEDMDLAVRVGLHGWKFVFVNDVSVKSELPSQFKAFRFQQHRWSCGPANLFRKMTMEIIRNKRVTIWKKLYVIYSFFFVRKIIVHFFTFFFYCFILPTSVFFPEVNIPTWSTVYFPFMITLFNAIATPRSFYLVIFWVLFENVMAMHRTKGTFIGLLEGGRVNEWVVTEKLGDALETKLLPQVRKPRNGFLERINSKEMMVGIYILCCASYNLVFGKTVLYIYLYMQALAFIIAGIGFIGT